MNKNEFLLLIFCFITYFPTLKSQDDKWEYQLEELRTLSREGQTETVLQYCDSLLQIIEKRTKKTSDLLTIKGTAYRALNQLDAAISQHEKALQIRTDLDLKELISNSLLNLGNCFLLQSKLVEAENFYLKSKTLKEELFPIDSEKLVGIYNSLGNFYTIKNDAITARFYLKKVLQIAQRNELNDSESIIAANISLANFWYEQQFPDSSIYHLNVALSIQENEFNKTHPQRALIYNNLGNAFAQKGFYEVAKEYLDTALQVYNALNFPLKVAETQYNLGNNFLDEGNIQKALSYYKVAKNNAAEDFLLQAQIQNSIGLALKYFGEISEAKQAFQEAINLYISIENEQFVQLELGEVYANLGKCFLEENQFKPADYFFQKTLKLYFENEEDSTKTAYLLMKLAAANIQVSDFETAEKWLSKATNYLSPTQKLPQFSLNYYWGEFWEAQNNLLESERFYNKARLYLPFIPYSKNEAEISRLFPFENVQILMALSRVKLKMDNTESLNEANIFITKALKILNNLKGKFDNLKTEISLQDSFYEIYNLAIEINLKLAKSDPKFKEQAFILTENYRANLLKKLAQKAKLQAQLSLPKEVLEQEKNLQKALTFYEKRKYELEQNEFFDKKQMAELDKKILNIAQEKEVLQNEIRQRFPDYHQLLYDFPEIKISEIQKNLSKNQSLLTYQWGEEVIYLFLINTDTFLVETINNATGLDLAITEMSSLYQIKAHLLPQDQKAFLFEKFVALSNQLYEKLIQPIESNLKTKLTILPDGPLFHLPFELLIREPAKENRFLRGHDYLLKNYAIHYHYSANTLLNNNEISNAENNLLVIAPKFQDSTLVLKHNEKEADLIHELLGGDIWKKGEDSKRDFSDLVEQYRVFHLSTHGFMNDKHPEYSKLIFSGNEPLFVSEIYDLPMQKTEMVVLSACQTAIGKLYRGEGLLSLAHGFSYAGAQSLVASLWNVDDSHTPELMQRFYQNLKNGLPKSEAMQQAKLDYLKTASQDEAYPFYWAGFMVIGDDVAIDEVLKERSYWWVILVVVLIGILLFKIGKDSFYTKTRNL